MISQPHTQPQLVRRRHRHRRTRFGANTTHEGWDGDLSGMGGAVVVGFFVLLAVVLVCGTLHNASDPRLERALPRMMPR
jgi:hypothetical protein